MKSEHLHLDGCSEKATIYCLNNLALTIRKPFLLEVAQIFTRICYFSRLTVIRLLGSPPFPCS